MPQRLPLFPLGSVLFPGLVLPLNVFEPRYRALVHDLVGDDEEVDLDEEEVKGFGVVAIKSGWEVGEGNVQALHEVGCVALLRDVGRTEDGRYELVTVGATRFRVVGLDETAGTPYLTGLVEPFGDEEDEDVQSPDVAVLAEGVRRRFAEYRDDLDIGGADAPDDPTVLSYLVAAATVLTTEDRQRLLEAPGTADRLRLELDLLKRESALVQALGTVPAVDLPGEPANPN